MGKDKEENASEPTRGEVPFGPGPKPNGKRSRTQRNKVRETPTVQTPGSDTLHLGTQQTPVEYSQSAIRLKKRTATHLATGRPLKRRTTSGDKDATRHVSETRPTKASRNGANDNPRVAKKFLAETAKLKAKLLASENEHDGKHAENLDLKTQVEDLQNRL